jgi:hypothetical protein
MAHHAPPVQFHRNKGFGETDVDTAAPYSVTTEHVLYHVARDDETTAPYVNDAAQLKVNKTLQGQGSVHGRYEYTYGDRIKHEAPNVVSGMVDGEDDEYEMPTKTGTRQRSPTDRFTSQSPKEHRFSNSMPPRHAVRGLFKPGVSLLIMLVFSLQGTLYDKLDACKHPP